MMLKPKISIITPVYNGLPYIKECVESVLSQSFQDWEMLISDNCSTDQTRLYLDSITDSRIRIYKQEKNLGIYGNLNFLFSEARAEISQILCADDYFIDTMSITNVLSYWEEEKSVGFVRFNREEKTLGRLNEFEKSKLPDIIDKNDTDLVFFLFGNIPGNLSNVSLKTSIVSAIGGFNEKLPYAGDFEFWSRAARQFSMGISRKTIVYVRRHENVATNYLNKNGELYPQLAITYFSIFSHIGDQFDKKLLKLFFNIEICSSHMRTGLKSIAHKNTRYFESILNTKSPLFYNISLQLPLILGFSISQKFRQFIAFNIIKKVLNKSSL